MAAAVLVLMIAGCTGSSETQAAAYQVSVVAEGLANPVGVVVLPTGGLLVAEEGTGDADDSAGISLVAGGRVDRVVSGLPSGRDSGDLSGVPMVGLSPDGSTVYTSHFGAEALLTFPVPSQKAVEAGAVIGPDDLGSTMTPLNQVRLTNAFDIAFSPDGVPVVTDASENGVATLTDDGQTEFIHRFSQLRDPEQSTLQIDPVPTGIARRGSNDDGDYLVTLTGGCPYPDGSGRLVAVDGSGDEEVLATRLNMPIDVAVADDGTVWVLEFARFDPEASCFSGAGYQPGTGQLGRLEGDVVVPVLDNLDFPGAVAIDDSGALYVTEVFAGRVLKLEPSDAGDGVSGDDAENVDGEAELEASPAAPQPARPWRFTEVAGEVGLDFNHDAFVSEISMDPVAMMGGGVCWLDADGDDDLDLYLVNSYATADVEWWEENGDLPASRLYRNTGDGFEDWGDSGDADLRIRGNGCVAADLDDDGDTDMYVTADGPNRLLVNDGSGRFTEQAAQAGVDVGGWTSAAAVGDVDGDGTVDLFVGSYIDFERTVENPLGVFPQDYLGEPNQLFRGNGDGTFTDVTDEAGLDGDWRTLGALFSDLDGDGDLDLYLTNDGQANTLYENRSRDGSMELLDVTADATVGDRGSGMGVAGGDFDGDGAQDLMITNWEAELHALYRNLGSTDSDESASMRFDYSTNRIGFSGLGNGTTGWGTAWADFDNDTDVDLLIVNGRVPVSDLATDAEPVQLLGNLTAEGQTGQFRDWAARVGLEGISPLLGRGSAVADFDNDGDLDIAVNQIAGPVALIRNESPPGRSLTVTVDPPLPGTTVEVQLDGGTVVRRELYVGSSYLSSEDPRFHVGTGDQAVEVVEVTWPDGRTASADDVTASSLVMTPDS